MSDNKTFPFDLELQYHILYMMIKSQSFMIKCSVFLMPEFFESSYLSWFYQTIVDHYNIYSKVPEFLTLKNEIAKFSEEERLKYIKILEKIEASNYTDEEYLRQELTGWLRSRKFVKLHQKMEDLYNKNQRDSAYTVTQTAIQDIMKVDFVEDDVIKFDNIIDIINSVSNITAKRIPLGIPEFDNAMMGGIPKQTLTTILGVTNTGKSIVMLNVLYNAVLNNKKVLLLYHEGSNDQMTFRILSRITKIPYMRFYVGFNNMTNEEQIKILNAKDILNKYVVLKPWQKFGTTVEEVISYCKQKKEEFDFDLVISDYAQLLYTKIKHNEVRHNQAVVYRALSMMAAELDVAVLTAAQGNRAAQKGLDSDKSNRKLLGVTDISECYEIAQCSECVITLTRTKDDMLNNKAKLLLAKQRDGETNIAVECVTDLKKLVMYDVKMGIYPLNLSDNQEVLNGENTTSSGSIYSGLPS